MKISTPIMAALVAMGIVSQASATDPVVYLTGSTAFRSTVFAALSDNTGTSNSVFQAGTITYGTWGNSSAGSANYMVFHGTLTNGQPVYINCAWSGSEAGIASACNTSLLNVRRDGTTTPLAGSPETWVDYTTATLSSSGNVQSGNPGPNGSPANGAQLEASSHGADLAQADTSQAVSWTPATNNTVTALQDFGSEGVVTFTLSRNVNPNPSQDWIDCSNITLPQIITMTQNGYAPAWFISGNPNDLMDVYLVGRNLGSGTRMNFLSDSGYGSHRSVIQNSIGYGVDNRDPAQTNSLILQNEGNNGYESGGGVAKALADTGRSSTSGSCQQLDPVHNTGTNWFAIGYVAPSDALSTGNNGGQTPPLYCNTNNWITVDGVFSDNNNIENGQWWLWGHEHLYGKFQISGIQSTVGGVLFNAISSKIISQGFGVAPGGHDPAIPYGLMFVTKSSDVVFPSY
ncbi:MAG TPA: hypothetical protein VMA35_14170 [Candidatus Sulfopaludibacter sp.]|nr:hypothetical protein [Candidatus Sulfopaludibacter sp.]